MSKVKCFFVKVNVIFNIMFPNFVTKHYIVLYSESCSKSFFVDLCLKTKRSTVKLIVQVHVDEIGVAVNHLKTVSGK